MIVYLAAQYPRRNEMRYIAELLRQNNIQVSSRWIQEKIPLASQLHDSSVNENLEAAHNDREDIDKADTLVLFGEDPLVGLPRGTHHVEFGYAMGRGKRLIVINGPENIFQYFPEVVHYPDLDSFLEGERIDNADVAD